MKTAISVPDDVFQRAEAVAKHRGLSRSELYVQALRAYLAEVERADMTEQIDAALDEIGREESQVDPLLAAAQARVLERER